MSFSCQKGEFDRFFNRLDRPVEESRPDRQPDRPVDPTDAGRPDRFPSLVQYLNQARSQKFAMGGLVWGVWWRSPQPPEAKGVSSSSSSYLFIYQVTSYHKKKTATSSRSITKASKYAIPLKPNTQTCRVKAIFSHLVRRQRRTERSSKSTATSPS